MTSEEPGEEERERKEKKGVKSDGHGWSGRKRSKQD